MEATSGDFQRHFELLSDAALLEINRHDLVELAKQRYDEEVLRRGLGVTVTMRMHRSSQSEGR